MTIPLLGGHWSNWARNGGCNEMYRDPTPGVRLSKRKGAWRIDETTQADGLVVRRTGDICSLTARILDAAGDRLLVNIQSDVIHMSVRSLRGCSRNQRFR